jgi:t-SNARE complex subunit (syntaxin)
LRCNSYPESSGELEELIDKTNLEAQEIRNRLKALEENSKKNKGKGGPAQAKIRANMQGALTKKFLDLMQEYQELQTKYKNKFRERIATQYKMGL